MKRARHLHVSIQQALWRQLPGLRRMEASEERLEIRRFLQRRPRRDDPGPQTAQQSCPTSAYALSLREEE